MIDQDVPHRLSRRAHKVLPVLEPAGVENTELEICLVHQCGRLKRLPTWRQISAGHLAKMLVGRGDERIIRIAGLGHTGILENQRHFLTEQRQTPGRL